MDAPTATKPVVFVIDIKTDPALFHHTNNPRRQVISVNHTTFTPPFVPDTLSPLYASHCLFHLYPYLRIHSSTEPNIG